MPIASPPKSLHSTPTSSAVRCFCGRCDFFLDVAAAVKADDPAPADGVRRAVGAAGHARPCSRTGRNPRPLIFWSSTRAKITFRDVVELTDRSPRRVVRTFPALAFRMEVAWRETTARPLRRSQSAAVALRDEPHARRRAWAFCKLIAAVRSPARSANGARWNRRSACARRRACVSNSTRWSGSGLARRLLADAGLNLNQRGVSKSAARRPRDRFPGEARADLRSLSGQGTARASRFPCRRRQRLCRRRLAILRQHRCLANVERRYDEARFDETLRALGEVATSRGRGHRRSAGRYAGEFSPEFRAGATAALRAAGLSLRGAAVGADGALAARAPARLRSGFAQNALLPGLAGEALARGSRFPDQIKPWRRAAGPGNISGSFRRRKPIR